MKKLLLTLLFFLNVYFAYSVATVAQKEWRWRKDDGNETAATYVGDSNNDTLVHSICEVNDILRLRISFLVNYDRVNPNGAASKNNDWRLSYSDSPSGPWTKIGLSANLTTEHFVMATSANVSAGTTTQQISPNPYSYIAGTLVDGSNTVGNISFSTYAGTDSYQDFEWVLMPTEYVAQDVYYFKLEGLDGYDADLPSIKVGSTQGTMGIANVSCNGADDGEMEIVLSGGTAPYSYSWSTGASDSYITELAPGSYTVTITNDNGCVGTNTAVISEPDLLVASASLVTPECAGYDGEAEVTVTGGTEPYSYQWSNGMITSTISNLTIGTYTAMIEDDNGCQTSDFVTVSTCASVENSVLEEKEIRLFPNPVDKNEALSLTISENLKVQTISLFDVRQNKVASATSLQDLNLENLESGMYTIEIITDKGVSMEKLIVK